MNKRTIRKRRGGFIFTGITALTIGIGSYKLRMKIKELKKELKQLNSKQLRQLLKKVSPNERLKSDKSIIKYILSKIRLRNKKTKGIIKKTKQEVRHKKKQYKLCKLYLNHIKNIKK